jgi:hypothetical protein
MTKRAKWDLGIIVVLVLLGLLIPLVIAHSRRADLRSLCATHLKSLGTVCAVYASANNDANPIANSLPPGSWMCDVKGGWADALMSAAEGSKVGGLSPASVQKWFLCPANTRQSTTVVWSDPTAPYQVMGYVFPEPPPKLTVSRNASTTELALDWIISDKPTAAGASWTGITAAGRPGIYDTNHVKGNTPTGANVLAFDGSVTWRSFNPANATPIPQVPGGPTFWIPKP